MAARREDEKKIEVSVVAMTEADLDSVLVIEKSSFSSPWTRQSFLFDLHDNPFAHPVVARDGAGRVLGYGCTWRIHGELRINNIAVRRDRKGAGIGRAMLRHMLDQGRQAGCRIALLEVRPSNAAARGLYQSEGFVQIGRRKNYYTAEHEDALVLALELTEEE